MDFPITELMDGEACLRWLEEYYHPQGQKCPHCQADITQANRFRKTKSSQLPVYRCKVCHGIYNVYSGTIFEGREFRPEQTVLFLRGVLQGEPTAQLARELGISRKIVSEVRHQLQANVEQEQPQDPLEDLEVETDEMFQNAGEKRRMAR
jgi:transposase-like protein